MPRPDPYIPIDTVAPPLVAELCDTFFFGVPLFLDTLTCVLDAGDSRAVHGIFCILGLYHVVSIRATCLRFPILTRTQGAKGS